MKTVSINREDGARVELKIPEKPGEITFQQFVTFDNEYRRLLKKVPELIDGAPAANLGYVSQLVQVLIELYPGKEKDLRELNLAPEINREALQNATALQMAVTQDNLDRTIDSLEAVIGWWYRLIYEWEPELIFEDVYRFKHKDKEYELPEVRKDAVFKKYQFGKITLQKVIEISELHRLIKKKELQNAQSKTDKDGNAIGEKDPNGSLHFTRAIHTIAMLVNEKGKETPTDPKEFERVVERRVTELQDIPMTHGRYVAFFLLSMKNH